MVMSSGEPGAGERAAKTGDPARGSSPSVAALLVTVAAIVLLEVLAHEIVTRVWPDAEDPIHRTITFVGLGLVLAAVTSFVILRQRGWQRDRTREHRLAIALSQSSDDLIILTDGRGVVSWVSPAYERKTGWDLESLLAAPWFERVHPEDAELVQTIRAACIADHKAGSAIYRVRLREGRFMWVETDMIPLFTATGDPDGFLSRSRDVSKFIAMRDELSSQAVRTNYLERVGQVGMWEAIPLGERLVWSDGMYPIFGLAPGTDVRFDMIRVLIHPEDAHAGDAWFERVLAGGVGESIVLRVLTPHRGERSVEFAALGLLHDRAIGSCCDVTQRVAQRRLLETSEARLRSVLEHVSVAIAFVDRQGRFSLVSRAWRELVGDEVSLSSSIDRLAAPLGAELRRAVERVGAGWSASGGQAPLRPNDETSIVRWAVASWIDEQGERCGAVLSLEPAASLGAAEQAAREARDLLDESQALARIGSWSFDLRTGAVQWSREVFRLFQRDESLGPPDYAWVLGSYQSESSERLDAAVRRAMHEGISYDLILRPKVAAPGVRVLRGRGRPVFGPDGVTVVSLVGTVGDATGEVEREEELRAAREAADRGNRAKSEFLASMSHEIRTPMTAILGYAELLAVDGQIQSDPVRVREAAETIRGNGRHLLAIINDILDLSKIEAGKLSIERLPTDVGAVLFEVLHLLGPGGRAKGLTVTLDDRLPKPLSLMLDPIRFRQVVVNLVANAVKFTNAGTIRVEVTLVESAGADPLLSVAVIDSGIGMSDEQISRLFRPFEQGDASTARRFGGTGLGLRISGLLAEMMGGRIEASSRVGEGSVFRLSLPVRRVHGGMSAREIAPARGAAGAPAADAGAADMR
jgi:PAS domain S-box-containing protein